MSIISKLNAKRYITARGWWWFRPIRGIKEVLICSSDAPEGEKWARSQMEDFLSLIGWHGLGREIILIHGFVKLVSAVATASTFLQHSRIHVRVSFAGSVHPYSLCQNVEIELTTKLSSNKVNLWAQRGQWEWGWVGKGIWRRKREGGEGGDMNECGIHPEERWGHP